MIKRHKIIQISLNNIIQHNIINDNIIQSKNNISYYKISQKSHISIKCYNKQTYHTTIFNEYTLH